MKSSSPLVLCLLQERIDETSIALHQSQRPQMPKHRRGETGNSCDGFQLLSTRRMIRPKLAKRVDKTEGRTYEEKSGHPLIQRHYETLIPLLLQRHRPFPSFLECLLCRFRIRVLTNERLSISMILRNSEVRQRKGKAHFVPRDEIKPFPTKVDQQPRELVPEGFRRETDDLDCFDVGGSVDGVAQ
jgi:hypothetical protein